MKSAWVRRTPDIVFDPWGIEPTITVKSLTELDTRIETAQS
jgi:2-haloacid dehalogenase